MKNFAIIINFEEKQCIWSKQKRELARVLVFKQCVQCNLLSSAVDRRDALGIGSPNQPDQPKTKKSDLLS